MVSFNARIPKKRDTLSKENSAYNRAVRKNKYPTENQVFSDSESESSTDTEWQEEGKIDVNSPVNTCLKNDTDSVVDLSSIISYMIYRKKLKINI